MHCNDGSSFSYILSSAYQPQTVSQPNGFTSVSGLVGAHTCIATRGMIRGQLLQYWKGLRQQASGLTSLFMAADQATGRLRARMLAFGHGAGCDSLSLSRPRKAI